MPGQMTELIPGSSNPHFAGGAVRINSLGFRGAEPADVAGQRILAIGDSVTFGYGVKEHESFHAVATQIIRARALPTLEVVNAGLPSSGLPYYLHAIRRHCATIAPQVVLISVVLNDLTTYPAEVLENVPLPRSRVSPARRWDPVLTRSYTYVESFRLLKGMLYKTGVLDLQSNPGYHFPVLSPDDARVDQSWKDSFFVLDAVLRATSECKAQAVLAVFPLEIQLSAEALARYREGVGIDLAASATNLEPQRRLATYAADHAVPFLDFTEAFLDDPPETLFLRDLYVTHDPVHPSVRGHARAGALLAEKMGAWLMEPNPEL